MSEDNKKNKNKSRRRVIVQLIPTNKTHPQATAEGHIFNFNNKTRDLLTTYYTCVSFRKGCRAKLIVRKNHHGSIVNSILSGFHLQPHCQPNYAKVEAKVAVEKAKKLAIERPDLSTSQIITTLEQLVNDNEDVQWALPATMYISRNINRAKTKAKIKKNNNNNNTQDESNNFYYDQIEHLETDQTQDNEEEEEFENEENVENSQKKELRVVLAPVNCLVDSDRVNVTCDRCCTKFTSLLKFLSHLKTNNNNNHNNNNNKLLLLSRSDTNNPSEKENVSLRMKSSQNILLKKTSGQTLNKTREFSASKNFGKKPISRESEGLKSKPKPKEKDGECVCHECGLVFPTSHRLKSHLICHSNDFPFSCSFPNCSRRFKRQWLLTYHLLSHGSARSFLCSECGSTFRRNYDLRVHMKIHGERTKKCGECSLVFHRETSLRNHVRSVHRKEKPFVCPREDCGSTFKHRSSWRYHIMWHNGETPRQCKETGCLFKCIRPIDLTRHYRKTHAQKQERQVRNISNENTRVKQEVQDEEETATRAQSSNQNENQQQEENNPFPFPFPSQSFSTCHFNEMDADS